MNRFSPLLKLPLALIAAFASTSSFLFEKSCVAAVLKTAFLSVETMWKTDRISHTHPQDSEAFANRWDPMNKSLSITTDGVFWNCTSLALDNNTPLAEVTLFELTGLNSHGKQASVNMFADSENCFV